MIHVFLDDMRACPKGFVSARTAEECKLLLEDGEVDVLSLDFDLGWDQPTGMDVVLFMIAKQCYPREIYLHSSSISGRRSMYELLYQSVPEGVKLSRGPVPYERLHYIADRS
ncbi:cell division protein FtsJ [Paenibacillus doosanensis]|uniref:cyclic-phosphate processing receiver domain-containing protein n=1 Tax=Paenibacillus TaxID=44249 RepID=UPI00201E1147|nr:MULTISPECIES: cyclic-phosphate processing receiver domain-containing protein [Paenibacillus]MCS7461139.1 cell division protein FtsJ [Paenibacillus doosanensis]